jgi:2-keto-4-pentenoate hydratase/2-oxohepta-3-ene-1,7-dioic acid hydratase in catechol pathway
VRIASITTAGGPSLGLLADDGSVIDVRSACPEVAADLREVLELGGEALAGIAGRARDSGSRLEPDQVRFLPVIPRPHAVWCAALNYPAHVEEGNWEAPSRPPFFLRVAGSLCGHDEPIVQPVVSDRLDYEGELAVVIGRRARHVPPSDAYAVVAGYSCFNDGSVRDWQRHTAQITSGKNFTGTGAFGPWLTTPDEAADIEDAQLTTRLNGKLMQQTKIGEMIFGIPELVNYLSTITELLPGDVIVTGTPGGVGARQTPQVFLQPDDVVEVEIDRVGLLRNPVVREER